MIIACSSFTLRPLRAADAPSMTKYANNYNVWRNLRDYFPHPYKPEDAAAFVRMNEDQGQLTNFCIDVEGECAGVIGFVPQPDVYAKSADFGYWLGEPFWDRGIMTEAARQTAGYIFQHFDIVRLYAGVFGWNTASMRVLEKAGFQKECVFEDAIFKDGQLISEHRYSLLKKNWPS
jgi:[ribosomal protein S5]-alanine N-acetyltransferase